MDIIALNRKTIDDGRNSFNRYQSAVMAGSGSSTYTAGIARETGRHVIVGAIAACIDANMCTQEEVVNVAARVSKCSRSTVCRILLALTGHDPEQHLFGCENGAYFLLQRRERRSAVAVIIP